MIFDLFARYRKRMDDTVEKYGKTDPDFFRALRNYPDRVLKKSIFRHLPPLFSDLPPLPLSKLYVELLVSSRPQSSYFEGENPSDENVQRGDRLAEFTNALTQHHQYRLGHRLTLRQALDNSRHRKVVVLGDPGSGKSSLLRHLMHEILTATWNHRIVPFHVSLRNYWDFVGNLREYPPVVGQHHEPSHQPIPLIYYAIMEVVEK
ncbi:MAG: hypothetical protein HQL07_04080 [Nitrospirae bacterium]|nr:hypothetical protein [Magnetococcales bacterium]